MEEKAPLILGTDFVVVPTDDFEASCHFYGEVLELPCIASYEQAPGAEFQADNVTLAVMQNDAFGSSFAPNSMPIALRVADVAQARELLLARGVTFHTEPFDSGVCHQAIFSDPAGNPLSLHHRYADPKPGGDQSTMTAAA
jgi:predicted enzyme related to lactoylglutathione lyase